MRVQVYENYGSVVAANDLASGLSIVGCICIFVYFVYLKDARKFLQRVLMYLTLCNFWYCVAILLGEPRSPGGKCFVQGAMTTYFGIASIMWTGTLAFSLRELTEKQNYRIEDSELIMVFSAFGVPLVLTIVAYAIAGFGPANGRCWIANSPQGYRMSLFCFYLPLWITIGYSMWAYGQMRRHVQSAFEAFKDGQDGQNTSTPFQCYQLSLFPLAFGICWLSSSMLHILRFIVPNGSFPLLEILSVSTGSLQGFVNALICGFSPEFRKSSRCGCRALRRCSAPRSFFGRRKAPRVRFDKEPPEVLGHSFGFSTYDPANDPERSVDRDDSSSESSAERFGTLEIDTFTVEDRDDLPDNP